jgi:hypothetical protein
MNTVPKSLTVSLLRLERECTHSTDQGLLIPLDGTWYSSVTYVTVFLIRLFWYRIVFVPINTV